MFFRCADGKVEGTAVSSRGHRPSIHVTRLTVGLRQSDIRSIHGGGRAGTDLDDQARPSTSGRRYHATECQSSQRCHCHHLRCDRKLVDVLVAASRGAAI